MKKIKKLIAVTLFLSFMLGSTALAAPSTTVPQQENDVLQVKGQLLSTDANDKVQIKEIKESPTVTDIGTANPVASRVTLPGMLIYSVIANPLGIEIATGEIYVFPNIKAGYEFTSGYPTNSVLVRYDTSITSVVEQLLYNEGFEFIGWQQSTEYVINTALPKMLESRILGVTQPIIRLSSNDRQRIITCVFEYLAPSNHYQQYQAIFDGNLVSSNLDGSAAYTPFQAGIVFNVQ